jgi:hypothetical protein
MYRDIANGSTPIMVFLMVSTDDGTTAVTGLTPTVQVSKNGGAFATATNSVSEIANGWYKVTLTATETNTNGPLIVRATGTGAIEWREVGLVRDAQPDVNVYSVESGVTVDANIVSEDAGYTPSDATLATATIESIASEVLGRTVAEARSDGNLPADEQYTLAGAILATAGKNAISGSTLNTYEEGEVNIAFSRTVTTSASAEPITSVA